MGIEQVSKGGALSLGFFIILTEISIFLQADLPKTYINPELEKWRILSS